MIARGAMQSTKAACRLFHCFSSASLPRPCPSYRVTSLFLRYGRRGIAVQKTSRKGRKSTLELPVPISNEPLPEMPQEEEPAAGYPTVIQQARNNMHKFSDCVLLTRVGSFYELYFEQAEEIGPLLNMKVASKRTALGRVPMAGFPFFQLDRYLKILVHEHGRHVAISEQQDIDPAGKVKSGGLMFDRKVQRVITPGTLIDETFLTPNEHNYLLAICSQRKDANLEPDADECIEATVGLAWLDLSSGDFFTQSASPLTLESAIARIGPREIILSSALDEAEQSVRAAVSSCGSIISELSNHNVERSLQDFSSHFESADVSSVVGQLSPAEMASGSTLLQYIEERLPGLQLRLQDPIRHLPDAFMSIDKNSLRGLEVTQTMKDGLYKGSLLHAVRRTSTESGARLLVTRLTAPSMSLQVINQRLDLVETFLHDEPLLHETTHLLKRTSDTLRIVQKFSLGRGDADDLLNLANTIHLTRELGDLLSRPEYISTQCLGNLHSRFQFDGPSKLADRISKSIDQEGLLLNQRKHDLEEAQAAGLAREALEDEMENSDFASLSKRVSKIAEIGNAPQVALDGEIWIMRRSASPTLSRLHSHLSSLFDQKEEFTQTLRETLGAQTLTLKFTPGLGHIVHVKGKDIKINLDDLPSGSRMVSSSKSTRSFYHAVWTSLGKEIDDARLRIRSEETRVLNALREQVITNLVALRRNAGILDEIDVACSSARLAAEHRLTRPRLNSSTRHNVVSGRHLMVEDNLSTGAAGFTPNDCQLGGHGQPHIWLVTGPNMAGKSTFLRQSALLSILAQTGSFVPAAHAEMGLVDAVFSRVGSADNLSGEQSTFMVEMLETAAILRSATSRSFVIMDEVGRGTTPEDGVAVGYAVLRYLSENCGCRALFATHFHGLADMIDGGDSIGDADTSKRLTLAHGSEEKEKIPNGLEKLKGIECWCTGVEEDEDGGWRYDHRLRPGVNRESHALKVALLAGMPKEVLGVAEQVLRSMGRKV